MEIFIDWSPQLLLLTKLDESIRYIPEGATLSILLSAVRSTVAQAWRDSKTPLISVSYNKIWIYYKIARFTDAMNFNKDAESAYLKFEAIWHPILALLAHQ